jgi:hypothetical protein
LRVDEAMWRSKRSQQFYTGDCGNGVYDPELWNCGEDILDRRLASQCWPGVLNLC